MQQGDTAPAGASNAGEVLDPYRSHQLEVGAKYAPHRDLLLTAALFGPNVRSPTPTIAAILPKTVRKNRGLELMADGHVTSNLRLFGGATARPASA